MVALVPNSALTSMQVMLVFGVVIGCEMSYLYGKGASSSALEKIR